LFKSAILTSFISKDVGQKGKEESDARISNDRDVGTEI